ncbi:hypothetical protein H310_06285 [Aphanomyces invadans]|uniref:Tyrosine-protein phosphatase domain-containing protein n=1 Tax=Aphanomyces invadans TaxID=157072 RepID=A0A024U7S3_9STRA|nr:hypothetical protein H310_06285 [Aphanomyces invadans]ETW01663.1 hypothetical protein H310_06285 [Aphanomyces invadans]|eukprot:XP_008869511.1 hypothetical protein H310_06285 [Aphanomyces invadans]
MSKNDDADATLPPVAASSSLSISIPNSSFPSQGPTTQPPSAQATTAGVFHASLPVLNPPLYFGIVESEVFRCNKFDSSSFSFVSQLALNTVVYLSTDDLGRELSDFFKERDVQVLHLGAKYRNSKGITEGMTKEAIECILDQRRYPIMVMCKTGIHISGYGTPSCSLLLPRPSRSVIGCLRRLQNWSLTATIDKYRNLAGTTKTKFENEQFIEFFDVDLVTLPPHLPDWFVLNQRLLDEERAAMARRECFPGVTTEPFSDEYAALPAYQRYYFNAQGPLTSPSVSFSEKLSLIGDDDGD